MDNSGCRPKPEEGRRGSGRRWGCGVGGVVSISHEFEGERERESEIEMELGGRVQGKVH